MASRFCINHGLNRLIRPTCFTLIFLIMLAMGEQASAIPSTPTSPFDDYGRICWRDEKARLDNFAIALINSDRTTLGHIIVYDDKRACRDEAVARAVRAKKYLVEYRKVEADRVLWRWGGYSDGMRTTLVITPYGASIWELSQSVPLADVTFVGNCNHRVRPVACANWDQPKATRKVRLGIIGYVVLPADYRAYQTSDLRDAWAGYLASPLNETIKIHYAAGLVESPFEYGKKRFVWLKNESVDKALLKYGLLKQEYGGQMAANIGTVNFYANLDSEGERNLFLKIVRSYKRERCEDCEPAIPTAATPNAILH